MLLFRDRILKYISSHGFKRYFKNTSWMFFGQIISSAASFLVGVLIARYLGPDQYGLLSYILSFVGLFGFLSSLGIDSIIYRELVKDNNSKNKLLGTGFVLMIIGGVLAVFFTTIFSFFISGNINVRWLMFVFSLTYVLQSFGIISILFQSQVKAKYNSIAQIVTIILSSIIKLLFVYFGLDIRWFIYSYVIDSIIIAINYLILYKSNQSSIGKWKFDLALSKKILKNSWPLMFSVVAVVIYMKIDQVMIGSMMDTASVGIYAAAVKLSEAWYFIPSIICASIFPAIINAKGTDELLYKNRLNKLYGFLFWIAFLLAIFITFFADWIIWIFYGDKFLISAGILKVHIWAGISVFLGYAVSKYLIAENKNLILFFTTALGAIVNIALNFILIPKIGIVGAALATLISYFVATFSIVLFKTTRSQIINIINGIFLRN